MFWVVYAVPITYTTGMSGVWVLLLLIAASSIPAVAVYTWYRIARYPFSGLRFLLLLLTGAAAYFPVLLLQSIIPASIVAGRQLSALAEIFLRTAFIEEVSRLFVLLIFFFVARRIAHSENTGAWREVMIGSAAGLVAGFGFAILESVIIGAANAAVIPLRLITAAPIHAACGARTGAAVVMFRAYPGQAVLRFLTAIAIHGIYNSIIIIPGLPAIAAVFIALSALASSILSIHSGMKQKQELPSS